MIAQILAFVSQFWRQIIFWSVLDAEQVGFIRRIGVPARAMKPGLNWKIPWLETAEIEDGRAYAYILDPQSVKTADDIAVVVRLSVVVRVVDAERYFLSVFDGRSNVQDVACGEIATAIQGALAARVLSGAVLPAVLRRVRSVARRWGMRVDSIKFVDAAIAPSARLWQSTFSSSGQD